MAAELIKQWKCFGGFVRRYRHQSSVLGCDMHFSVFYPPAAADANTKLPIIYFLSGLTCTDENFIQKAGAQRCAAQSAVALVAPDTSPRGLGVPGEDDSWDFGSGAGFYVNATNEPWKQYRMEDYIVKELPDVLRSLNTNLDVDTASVMGHSMGGHGALTLAMRYPGTFKSVSAFSPICNPSQVPWGQKAFSGYLGESNKESWKAYDATELAKSYDGPAMEILVDTGSADEFLEVQLRPQAFEAAAAGNDKINLVSNMREEYDHSYFFIASFVEDHVNFHAERLK